MNESINVNSLGFDECWDLIRKLKGRLSIFTHRGRTKRYDYEQWDWTKNNRQLAQENNVTIAWVSVVRKELGKAHVPGGKLYPACLSWDWTKSDTAIAREHGLVLGSVSRWRRNLNKPPVPRKSVQMYEPPPLKQTFDFSAVNWEKPDADIGRELKCTRELVRQKRALYGQPKRYANELKYAEFLKAVGDIKAISSNDAKAKWAGFNYITFKKYCLRAGIKVVRSVRFNPWHLMNFQLPNKLLTEIWAVRGTLVGMYRARNPAVGRALFMSQDRRPIPSKYLALVEVEMAKAEEWRKTKLLGTPAAEPRSQNGSQTTGQSVPV